ncbi:MAG: DUF4268 domain-containing protein [Syntrophales bacterium]|nr:DUF4268 domain-containing protein [Syntrophales bacterium]
MNDKVQQRQINRFLKEKGNQEIDAFCIYQWIDRCHYQGWWDYAVALGASIPPNSLTQDYHKRIEFLLSQCRNQINQRKDQFIEIENAHATHAFPLPKAFIDIIDGLGLKLEGRGQSRIKLKYFSKRLLFLEKLNFDGCVLYFTDRTCEAMLTWLQQQGFSYLADSIGVTNNGDDERRARIKISWNDATALLPILFTQDYLDEIKKEIDENVHQSSIKWNAFGHRTGSQAAKIDELLLEGATLSAVASAIGSTIGRVKGHIRHLEKDKGIKAKKVGNIYKILTENIPVSRHSKSLNSIKPLQLKFWSGFKQFALEEQSALRIAKVYPQHWLDIYFGHHRCHICMTINTNRDIMTCELYIPDAKDLFHKLLKYRNIIEQQLGESLQWNELPGKKASRIKLIRDADVTIEEKWTAYFSWLKEKAENFQEIFSEYALVN